MMSFSILKSVPSSVSSTSMGRKSWSSLSRLIAARDQRLRLHIVRLHDHRVDGEGTIPAMEVEAIEIGIGHLIEHAHRRIPHHLPLPLSRAPRNYRL